MCECRGSPVRATGAVRVWYGWVWFCREIPNRHAAVIDVDDDADEQAQDHREKQVAVSVRDLHKQAVFTQQLFTAQHQFILWCLNT